LLTKPPTNQFPPVPSPVIDSIQPAPRSSVASAEFLLECIWTQANFFFPEGVLLGSVAKLAINDGNSSIVERYSPPFVRKGVQASVEDPFATTSRGSPQVTPTGPKSKGRAAKSDNWRSGSSSGSSAGRSSPSPSRYLVSKRGLDIFVKKYESEDDQTEFYQQVAVAADASRAQSLFPPACCVFVAK
jgi:hypothetical protein